jgi:hypothetical protein
MINGSDWNFSALIDFPLPNDLELLGLLLASRCRLVTLTPEQRGTRPGSGLAGFLENCGVGRHRRCEDGSVEQLPFVRGETGGK